MIRRYKRFLADVRFEDGSEATAYCTNSGSRKSCLEEVKNVSMKVGDDALFPDAVTSRGRRHLNTLMPIKI